MNRKPVHRVLSLFCAAALLISLIPLSRAASSDFTVSDELVDVVKRYEGFSPTAVNDGTGWYIGYGSSCGRYEYPDGISEAKAESLLRSMINLCADLINSFAEKNGLTLTQNQFDALACFTYNLGNKWMTRDSSLARALKEGISGYSDLEVINLFGVYCHIGSSVSSGLAKRRIEEACIFLYGDYSGDRVSDYTYLILRENGGEADSDVAFYVKGEPYGTLPTAEKSGASLTGWKKKDGTMLSASDLAQETLTVTAVWGSASQSSSASSGTSSGTSTNTSSGTSSGTSTDTSSNTGTSSGGSRSSGKTSFSDVRSDAWYYTCVSELASRGVISGFPDGSFRPDADITLGAALKLILLTAGFEEQEPVNGHWASGYAALAVMEGMISAADVANLDGPASRLLIAQVAAQCMGLEYSFDTSPFSDTADGFAIALYQKGIFTGEQVRGKLLFNPRDSISRSELSAVLWRMSHAMA